MSNPDMILEFEAWWDKVGHLISADKQAARVCYLAGASWGLRDAMRLIDVAFDKFKAGQLQ